MRRADRERRDLGEDGIPRHVVDRHGKTGRLVSLERSRERDRMPMEAQQHGAHRQVGRDRGGHLAQIRGGLGVNPARPDASEWSASRCDRSRRARS